MSSERSGIADRMPSKLSAAEEESRSTMIVKVMPVGDPGILRVTQRGGS
jgi:hypothetical protein